MTARMWQQHPEVPLIAAAVTAWLVLGVSHYANHDVVVTEWRFSIAGWSVMVAAMMLPAIAPMQRWVVFQSLRSRQKRAAALFGLTYVAFWVVLGAVGAALVTAGQQLFAPAWTPQRQHVAGVIIVAALWQLAPAKKRALRRCHLRLPLATRGHAADRSIIRYGAFHARWCAVSCGPAMAAMLLAAHDFHLMVPVTAMLLYERLQARPNELAGAVGLAVTALFVLLGG